MRMTSPSQLETVRKEIEDVKANIQEKEKALAAARRERELSDVDFLRERIIRLDERENYLYKMLLQGQASGQHN